MQTFINHQMFFKKSKAAALAEVLIVFLIIRGIYWVIQWVPSFQHWQENIIEWPIVTILLGTVLVPILAMRLSGRVSFTSVITGMPLIKGMKITGKALGVMLPVIIISFPIVNAIGYTPYEWPGALMIALCHLLALPVICLVLKKEEGQSENVPFSRKDHGIILSIFIISTLLVFASNINHPTIARIIISLIFIGLAEEFMYRGYMQRLLNRVFGKPYTFLNYSFGYGLIITSLLFGLAHVLNPVNPWHWPWGFWTIFAGLAYGVIRDKGGSFIISGAVHGTIMVFPIFIS